jgi:hypothetical protein
VSDTVSVFCLVSEGCFFLDDLAIECFELTVQFFDFKIIRDVECLIVGSLGSHGGTLRPQVLEQTWHPIHAGRSGTIQNAIGRERLKDVIAGPIENALLGGVGNRLLTLMA